MVIDRTGGSALGDDIVQIIIGQFGILGMDRLCLLSLLLLFQIFGTPVEKGDGHRSHHHKSDEAKEDLLINAHNVLMTFLWTFSHFSRSL